MRGDMLLLEMSNSSYREYIESRKESGNIFEIIELERNEDWRFKEYEDLFI